MLINDLLVIEIIILLNLYFYIINPNLMILLYTGGLYLTFVGNLLLKNNYDIFVGFLWVIDLGVGLVFLVFILHYTFFLQQKTLFDVNYKLTYLIIPIIISCYTPTLVKPELNIPVIDNTANSNWFFKITSLNFYNTKNIFEVTELNLIKEFYFTHNSFEFFIINFSLVYGLVAAVIFYFITQRVYTILNYSQIKHMNILSVISSSFFIKTQNFINQNNTSSVTRVWVRS